MSEALDFDLVAQQAAQAARELLEAANPAPGDFFVVGCSSSEIVGGHIGKDSSHCNNSEGAHRLSAGIRAKWPDSKVTVLPCGGLTSFYAEEQGIILGF